MRLAICALAFISQFAHVCAQTNPADGDGDKWFEEDIEEQARQVNEGALHFLSQAPEASNSHALENQIHISATSLKDHWVKIRQCHTQLDPVAQSQIVYRYQHMRNLHIEQHQAIGKAWVEGQSVQMEDLQPGAKICVRVEAQIFQPTQIEGKDAFILTNGPFYRKFLDGYYPFHLQFTIDYPANLLRFDSSRPEPQAGVNVTVSPGRLHFDIWFEGELSTAILFQPLKITKP